jgi:hypothetical protein
MNVPPSWSESCICGRTFSLPQAYTYHQRSCQKTKKRLSGVLEKAKDILQSRKRHKAELESLLVVVAPTLAPEAASSYELPIPTAHSEVRFPFTTIHCLPGCRRLRP